MTGYTIPRFRGPGQRILLPGTSNYIWVWHPRTGARVPDGSRVTWFSHGRGGRVMPKHGLLIRFIPAKEFFNPERYRHPIHGKPLEAQTKPGLRRAKTDRYLVLCPWNHLYTLDLPEPGDPLDWSRGYRLHCPHAAQVNEQNIPLLVWPDYIMDGHLAGRSTS